MADKALQKKRFFYRRVPLDQNPPLRGQGASPAATVTRFPRRSRPREHGAAPPLSAGVTDGAPDSLAGVVIPLNGSDAAPLREPFCPPGYAASLDRLDEHYLELRGLQTSFAETFAALALAAPHEAIRQEIRALARRLESSFHAQDAALDYFLNP